MLRDQYYGECANMAGAAPARSVASPGAKLVHVFPSFSVGGPQLRMVRVINHLGRRYSHVIVSLDGNFDAAAQLAEIDVTLLHPPSRKRGVLRSVAAAARLLRSRPDLLMTYNWGSIEWAIANRLLNAASHIHFEAGFGKEEADGQIARRIWCRRWALAQCNQVVVPSYRLTDLAINTWKLAPELVKYVPNGVDIERFAAPPRDKIPGFTRRPGELVVGTVAPLRPEKNIARLLRVFAMLRAPVPVRLVIAGDGSEREALEQLAMELGVADRVLFTGHARPEAVLGTFDIFALSSDTEQMPNALLEAMAAQRAVAAVDVGDVKTVLAEPNREFVVPRDDPRGFADALCRLLRDETARATLGRHNLARVMAKFSQERMFTAYAELLDSVVSRKYAENQSSALHIPTRMTRRNR